MNKVLGNPVLEPWPHFSEKVLEELEAPETEANFSYQNSLRTITWWLCHLSFTARFIVHACVIMKMYLSI